MCTYGYFQADHTESSISVSVESLIGHQSAETTLINAAPTAKCGRIAARKDHEFITGSAVAPQTSTVLVPL